MIVETDFETKEKGDSDQYQKEKGQNVDEKSCNKFKEVFKYYKRRQPPPSLDSVLDPHNPEHSDHFTSVDLVRREESGSLHCCPVREWRVLEVRQAPGLKVLTGVLGRQDQLYWAHECLEEYSRVDVSRRNIDSLGAVGEGDWWARSHQDKLMVDRLRWATLGYHHDWDTKQYSEGSRGSFPRPLYNLSSSIAASLGWQNYKYLNFHLHLHLHPCPIPKGSPY